jgi:hypothetical protein
MRSLRFMPIAFVAGVHGFLIFAPYAAVVLVGRFIVKRNARRQQNLAMVVVEPLAATPI